MGQLHNTFIQIIFDQSFLHFLTVSNDVDGLFEMSGELDHFVIAVPHNAAQTRMLLLLDEYLDPIQVVAHSLELQPVELLAELAVTGRGDDSLHHSRTFYTNCCLL